MKDKYTMNFIKIIQFVPYVLIVAGLSFGAHKFITYQLESEISTLQQQVQEYQAVNIALQTASQTNEDTIRSLENRLVQQSTQITRLTSANQELTKEKDEYLSIFRRHDLTRLALARPGLIEPRLNDGTKNVFEQIEQDSRDILE